MTDGHPNGSAHRVSYDAFVSYSHAKDKPIATALQSMVQKLGKPWYRRRALRLFRDDTSLTANAHLWPTIERSLSQSRYLILLASEEAAASPWVEKEVSWWLNHRSSDSVLIALTSGQLKWAGAIGDFDWSETTPLPQALQGRFVDEPRWIDLRPYRDGASPRDRKFMEIAAEFAAAMHGRPKEDLLSEEVRQQRVALRLAATAVLLLLIFLGIAVWAWILEERARQSAVLAEQQARQQRERAEHDSAAAQEAARALVFDLAQDLSDKTGIPQELVGRILERAEQVLQKLAESSGGESSLVGLEAEGLLDFGETLEKREEAAQALVAYRKSQTILERLVANFPKKTDWQAELAICNTRIGEALLRSGDISGASKSFQAGHSIRETLVASDPNNLDWQLGLAISVVNLSEIRTKERDYPEAIALLRGSKAAVQRVADSNAPDAKIQDVLFRIESELGDVFEIERRPRRGPRSVS